MPKFRFFLFEPFSTLGFLADDLPVLSESVVFSLVFFSESVVDADPDKGGVDTTGAGSARNGYIGRGENITDSLMSGRPSFTENNNSSEPSPTDRLRFRAINADYHKVHNVMASQDAFGKGPGC